jgi:versiconal hemiacetal acetate esterase
MSSVVLHLDRKFILCHPVNNYPDRYGASPTEPLYSLLLNPNLSKLPPIWLVACSKDPTYDEMRMFHDKLMKQGVQVSLEVCKGYPHFFWMLPMMSKSQELMTKWASHIREMVA